MPRAHGSHDRPAGLVRDPNGVGASDRKGDRGRRAAVATGLLRAVWRYARGLVQNKGNACDDSVPDHSPSCHATSTTQRLLSMMPRGGSRCDDGSRGNSRAGISRLQTHPRNRVAGWRARACTAVLVVLAGSMPTGAQTVPVAMAVRAGEHGSFTRITVALESEAGWRLGRTEAGYRLAVDGPARSFDLAQLFTRISRARLARATSGEGALDLEIACGCHATAFVTAGSLLVIDLNDGPPPPGSPFEALIAVHSDGNEAIQRTESPARNVHPDGYDWARRIAASPTRDGTIRGLAEGPDLASIRASVLAQIGRAGDQGLLASTPADPSAARHPGGAAPGPAIAGNLRVAAETALDRAVRAGAPADAGGGTCAPSAALDVEAWGGNVPPAEAIAQRRANLLSDLDIPSPSAVTSLAKLYIFLGLAPEARAVIGAFGDATRNADILNALADLLDTSPPHDTSFFDAMRGCDGPAALWAVLGSRDQSTKGMNRGAVLRSFSALPPHLRQLLGPRLTTRLLSEGQTEMAHAVRDAVSRGTSENGGAALLEARLDLAEGRIAAALAALRRMTEADDDLAVEALALTVAILARTGGDVPAEMLGRLSGYAVEHRGSDLGPFLRQSEVLGLAAQGRFDAAFALLDQMSSQDPAFGGVAADTYDILVRQGRDADLLAHSLPHRIKRVQDLPDRLRAAFARRMLDLGLPSAALDVLPDGPETEEERLVAAEALLQLDDASRAFGLLAELTSEEAAMLRGNTLLALGRHAEAAEAYLDAGSADEAARAAWHSDDIRLVTLHGTGPQRRAVTAGIPDTGPLRVSLLDDPAQRPAGTLAERRSMLAASADLRSALSDLLDAHPKP